VNKVSNAKHDRQSGFGLIEVLVSVLILAVGLLGLAGLQAQSLRFNNDSFFRSQATLLAMDLADRMRANRDVIEQTPSAYSFSATQSVPASYPQCDSTECTPAQLAQYDFATWKTRALEVLPGVNASVDLESTASAVPWQTYIITLSYRSTGDDQLHSLAYRVRI
jgi:type IV pilus assembly protein PilV